MIEIIWIFCCLLTVTPLRVGFLDSSNGEFARSLENCLGKTGVKILSRSSCTNYNGIESAAELNREKIGILAAGECQEEANTISKLSSRWDKLFLSFTPFENARNTTLQLAPSFEKDVSAVISKLAKIFEWSEIVLVYEHLEQIPAKSVIDILTSQSNLTVIGASAECIRDVVGNQPQVLLVLGSRNLLEMVYSHLLRRHVDPKTFVLLSVDRYRQHPADPFDRMPPILSPYEMSYDERNIMRRKLFRIRPTAGLNSMEFQSQLLCDVVQQLKSTQNSSTLSMLNTIEKYSQDSWKDYISVGNRSAHYIFILTGYVDGEEATLSEFRVDMNGTYRVLRAPAWYRTSLILPDRLCGLFGIMCIQFSWFYMLPILTAICCLPLCLGCHYYWKQFTLRRMSWRIDRDKISAKRAGEDENIGFRRISSTSTFTSNGERRECIVQKVYVGRTSLMAHDFIQKRAINLSRYDMILLRNLKNLNYANVNSFFGICFNQDQSLTLFWTACHRGSLDDIIFGSGRTFGRDFQATFVKQILRGLQHIHRSSIKVHGNLFLSNCVVDNYWVVKLTDFGLNSFIREKMEHKELMPANFVDPHSIPRKYLQLPPEALFELTTHGDIYGYPTSVEGDIYQLGMVLYQILFIRRPFRECGEDTKEIARRICEGTTGSGRKTVCTPFICEPSPLSLRLTSIIQQCWQRQPTERPALFKVADAVAREFEQECKGSLIDQLIRMVDDYSTQLDEIVAEKTSEISQQLEKTEDLLYQLIPSTIAQRLLNSDEVEPRMYSQVAILVADVCRFNEFCTMFIPIKVIEHLNKLYRQFDDILENYLSKKVDNVGGHYIVACDTIPDCHLTNLRDILQLAIKLQKVMLTFETDLQRKVKVELKIGIARGSVATGIIGVKVPRYYVFGEAATVAFQCAKLCEPGKIQMLENTANVIISDMPEYIVHQGVHINIATKGKCLSYYLTEANRSVDEASLNTVE